jgi:hypothetical protein
VQGYRADHRFAATLEHLTGTTIPDEWFELDPGRLRELRRISAPAAEHAHLLIELWVPARAGATWPTEVVAHLRYAGNDWEQPQVYQCAEGTEAGVRAAVGTAIQDLAYGRGLATFTLGFVLPRHLMDRQRPESWEFYDELTGWLALFRFHVTVLHFAQRFGRGIARPLWTETVHAVHARAQQWSAPEVRWLERADLGRRLTDLVRNAPEVVFGLGFQVGDCPADLWDDPIVQVVRAGVPFVVWAGSDVRDWDTLKAQMSHVATDGDFADLPARLHDLRQGYDGPGPILRLIWDEPKALPPKFLSELPGRR